MNGQDQRAASITHEIRSAATVALSFPKAGRSWVCYFLAHYVAQRTGGPLELNLLAHGGDLPPTAFMHEHIDVFEDVVGPCRLLNDELLRRRRLLVLVRDPRDTLVSYWYQKRVRERKDAPERLELFADSPVYGIERISQGTNLLLDFYDSHPGDRLLASYESLRRDPAHGLTSVLSFVLDGRPIDERSRRRALRASDFRSMREWERGLTRQDARVRYDDRFGALQDGPLEDGDFKVRRGEVGGFKAEMSVELQQRVACLPHTAALIERLERLRQPV
jgi:Sulfotransferase domain